ncbi:hypothetical protein [Asanoa iriomotensis]|uniref:3-methyl-2-oxobutanoate hydroxymethyltransferase n=1 Tax=Asanoa iriomotensis TaxID=234613 RepID=A0ABQ4C3M7_9ACTN|nr:hypothetical protein [Asanoa iriomotensis]GIF57396.1 hypothetical protein Air01nite_34910 [Asanoa iriomotensis]
MARPVLLNSCARAATAAEARFRIGYPLVPSRATRVVALDDVAASAVRAVAGHAWHHSRFYLLGSPDGLHLERVGSGESVPLAPELDGVDAVVMVAGTADGASAAATIGASCTVRGVMTAGLVLDDDETRDALAALRPYARVLMVPADVEDLVELLRAIRA